MQKSWTMCGLSFLLIAYLGVLPTCSTPDDPFKDRSNVDATVTTVTPLAECVVGDSIHFQLKVILQDFIDSVQVLFGDDSIQTIHKNGYIRICQRNFLMVS